MNKKLSEIFNLVDNEILNHSQVVSMSVYTENRAMEVIASCIKMVRKESADKLESQIMEAYKLNDISLSFVYDASAFNVNSVKTVAGYLTEYPQLVPLIDNSECSLEGTTLHIDCVGSAIIEDDARLMLEDTIEKMFGIHIDIIFEQSRTEEEIQEQFEQDKQEIIENIEKSRQALEENKKKSPVIYGREIKGTPDLEISQINELSGNVIIDGYLFKKAPDVKQTRNGAYIITFSITDDKDAINCKIFTDDNAAFESLDKRLKKGTAVRVRGQAQYDQYAREVLINVRDINTIEWEVRKDEAEDKRVELHLHTKMSSMDAMTDAEVLVKQAIKWGHKAIAITDHGNVQAFPEAYHASNFGKDIKVLYGVECYIVNDTDTPIVPRNGEESNNTPEIKNFKTFHAIILVKTQEGMKNLYKIVSSSHLDYFYKRPRVPKSLVEKYRDGLILGSACEAGELYQEILKNPFNPNKEELEKIVDFYDYLEIQPLGNNGFMLRDNIVENEDTLKHISKTIINLAKSHNKLVVATCDVHFLNKQDSIYRTILQAGQGFKDADNQAPLYFRTTDEMLDEFEYLGEELAYEVVVTNTNKIAGMIDDLKPVPDEKAPPVIEGSDEDLRRLTYDKAKSIYGGKLPNIVKERVDIELESIINNGYSVLYIIAQKLVKKSNDDGYLVGSRGSVGSSLVAFMSGITEVNSLPPHYVCPKCKHSEFFADGSVGCGFDLPDKKCPECGKEMIKDGHDIPFQTFLGFKGDKEPDIDLNFSGEYQPVAHKYVEELFGTGHVFRAGTIATVADKTAYGFVKKYYDEKGETPSNAQIDRLVAGCTGVKRTTGQHPGGIIVVPTSNDVHEFSPIQHPADDTDTDIITLHFDYHSIDQNLLKLDILGHDDPTAIRMLEDLTGIDAKKIPLDDKDTMSLFTSTEALGIKPEEIGSPVGTFGVPEFGTKFVRQMLVDTKPTTFTELVRISGLSHGTDVWLNNAQSLIQEGKATLSQAICTRDDIMVYLIYCGVEKSLSFKIMESVRKGKGLTPEFEEAMRQHNIPDWYIESCKKIKYMFPKAHAVAYVTMAFRIAWFKVNRPKEYYATFFSVRADDFDIEIMGTESVAKHHRKIIEAMGNDANVKQKGVLTILELVCEMNARGINFLPIDLYKSDATKFIIAGESLLPPLNSIPGLGENAAKALVKAREEEPFCSIEDLHARGKISNTIVDKMRDMGILEGMPESSQISLFDL